MLEPTFTTAFVIFQPHNFICDSLHAKPNYLIPTVRFLSRIGLVIGSNFERHTGYRNCYRSFLQSLQPNTEIIPQIMPRSFPSESNFSFIALSLNAK
jgi:hypothetical protein